MRKETAERVFRAINNITKGHKRLLMPIVGLALLACTPGSDISSLSQPASAIKPDNSPPFDYCAPIDSSATDIEKSLAGIESNWRQITPESSEQTIDDIKITPASFNRRRISDETRMQALLIPVWYPKNESDQRMEYMVSILSQAYYGVNVEFAYIKEPVQLGVKAVQQRTQLNDLSKGDKLYEKVEKIHPVSKLIFVVNTSEYIGACCAVVVAGNNPKSGYTATHELAHDLGLSDGHKIRYPSGNVNNEELFKPGEKLPSAVQKALDATNAPVVSTGNICKDQPVSTFYDPSDNIMMDYAPLDSLLLENLKKKKGAFNPIQKAMMNQDIEQKFSEVKR